MLSKRLLTEDDLGEGYVRKAERTQRNDDVTVVGCPALDKLGAEAATGASLDFPRKAKISFTYSASSTPEVSEELYSDTAQKLSADVRAASSTRWSPARSTRSSRQYRHRHGHPGDDGS
ncbi:hypothetical protein SSP35_22_00050 [Streptomyces sp. NBRC 110611]|uniref:hypothetical protein n=1 Tax=Streptomyces sp. NBRC 110611 TaxID=1621259 RepID=UPI0008578E70|nr:hypothetical protein SSP35_22_00050 [Streptomyces sp. NBRC 110611]